jgi:uncharacterized protein (TIGR03905 family)
VKKIVYRPRGTCSQLIEIEVDDGIIKRVEFTGGCPGNLIAIAELTKGMKVSDAVERLDGIKCGDKKTSCADQLAQALKGAI